MKGDNKLKKFVEEHKLACAIVGGTVAFIAGAGLTYLGFRSITNVSVKDLKWLVGKDKNVDTLFDVARHLEKGTREVLIETYPAAPTVAEYFGEYAPKLVENSHNGIQLDDLVVNSMYAIAKKA